MSTIRQTLRLCATIFRNSTHGRLVKHRKFSSEPNSGIIDKYLFVTNTVVGGILMGIGDVLQQRIASYRRSKEVKHNWYRTRDMVVVGCALASVQHVFYKALEHFVPGKTLKSVTKKIALDLAIGSPIVIVGFIGGIGLLERRSADEILSEIKDKFLRILIVDCVIWPPIQYINFTYLPIRYRAIYVNVLMVIYDVFLSYMKHEHNPGKDRQ